MTKIHMKMLDVDQANLMELIEKERNLEKKLGFYKQLTETLLAKNQMYKQLFQNQNQHESTEEHY